MIEVTELLSRTSVFVNIDRITHLSSQPEGGTRIDLTSGTFVLVTEDITTVRALIGAL